MTSSILFRRMIGTDGRAGLAVFCVSDGVSLLCCVCRLMHDIHGSEKRAWLPFNELSTHDKYRKKEAKEREWKRS